MKCSVTYETTRSPPTQVASVNILTSAVSPPHVPELEWEGVEDDVDDVDEDVDDDVLLLELIELLDELDELDELPLLDELDDELELEEDELLELELDELLPNRQQSAVPSPTPENERMTGSMYPGSYTTSGFVHGYRQE
jgi:hypothetical protein